MASIFEFYVPSGNRAFNWALGIIQQQQQQPSKKKFRRIGVLDLRFLTF
jgi:hypothetical protein